MCISTLEKERKNESDAGERSQNKATQAQIPVNDTDRVVTCIFRILKLSQLIGPNGSPCPLRVKDTVVIRERSSKV